VLGCDPSLLVNLSDISPNLRMLLVRSRSLLSLVQILGVPEPISNSSGKEPEDGVVGGGAHNSNDVKTDNSVVVGATGDAGALLVRQSQRWRSLVLLDCASNNLREIDNSMVKLFVSFRLFPFFSFYLC
jgi:hypothetical protein